MTTKPTGPALPKVHTAVVAIRDHTDGESIASAAAAAAMSLLAKVSAEQRSAVKLDRVSITQPETIGGIGLLDLFAGGALADLGKFSVVVSVRVQDPEPDPAPQPAGEGGT